MRGFPGLSRRVLAKGAPEGKKATRYYIVYNVNPRGYGGKGKCPQAGEGTDTVPDGEKSLPFGRLCKAVTFTQRRSGGWPQGRAVPRGMRPAKRDGPAVRGFPGVSRRVLAKGAPEGKKAT